MQNNIVAFHLLNDYSGSPKVLYQNLKQLSLEGCKITLFTSKGGVLDELNTYGVNVIYIPYKFNRNFLLNILRFIWAQILFFFKGLKHIDNSSTVLINTILPFSGTLVGKIKKAKIVYHYHENAKQKSKLYFVLSKIMERFADEIICVSEYQRSFLARKENVYVIPNALNEDFKRKIKRDAKGAFNRKCVMMASSLKSYKGIKEFIDLSKELSEFHFILVINASDGEIKEYLKANGILNVPSNLKLYSRQKDMSTIYNISSLVLNLTDKNKAVETFGLTAVEAFSSGLPVIVPEIGGISELVENNINGYKIDSHNKNAIVKTIKELFTNEDLYLKMSLNAYSESQKFSESTVIKQIAKILQN